MKYILYWLDGKKEEVEGDTITNAVNNANYGGGAIGALDFYSEKSDEDPYVYINNEWRNTKIMGELCT